MHSSLNSKLLTRYWFPATRGLGIGVTAYSLPQAKEMALSALSLLPSGAQLSDPVTNVDVSSLDQGHVVPNMGPYFRGHLVPGTDALIGSVRPGAATRDRRSAAIH